MSINHKWLCFMNGLIYEAMSDRNEDWVIRQATAACESQVQS